jgi:NitT/TauT family transport system ATP-binding protein
MDEPFGALDALTRDQMILDLQRLCLDRQLTVLFVTHSIDEAVFLSDKVVIMSPRPGRVAKEISVDLPRPRTLALRESAEFSAYTKQILNIFLEYGVLHEE